MKMKNVGIVGFGSFGRFLAEQIDAHCHVLVYSASGKSNKWAAGLETVAAADFVILAIPLSAYESVLAKLKPLLSEQTVIVDVCSVKEVPIKIIQRSVPGQPVVATHPLFGPESAADGLDNHVLVLCPDASDAAALAMVEKFAHTLKLTVRKMTTREHDREMAVVQGLTFFIARTLDGYGLHEQQLSTPSFQKLLRLARLEEHHSDDLFYTIQSGNSQAGAVRQKFIELARQLDDDIAQHSKRE